MTTAEKDMENTKDADAVGIEATALFGLRGYFAVGLDNPKTTSNIAAALRACDCYGGAMLAASGTRYRKHGCDTTKAYRRMPFLQVEDLKAVIPYDCIPVGIELVDGAESLVDFEHPERAFYVFGAEDNTLGQRILSWCPRRVIVPTRACMNLAACVNVVLYDRLQKQLRYGPNAPGERPPEKPKT